MIYVKKIYQRMEYYNQPTKHQDNEWLYFDYVNSVFSFAQLIEITVAMRKHKRQQMALLFCVSFVFLEYFVAVYFLHYFLRCPFQIHVQ